MRHRIHVLVVCFLGLPCWSGCYHMYGPYGGYRGPYYGTQNYGYPSGYGGYPMYQGAPVQTLTPGQEYFPGTFTPGSVPPSTPQTFQDGTTTLQPLNNGTNAPAFTPDGKTQPVPDPYFNSPGASYSPPATSEFGEANLQPAGHTAEALPALDGVREVRGDSVGFPETTELDPIPSTPPRKLPDSVPADPMGSNYFPAHNPAPVEQPSAPLFEPAPVQQPESIAQPDPIPAASDLKFEAPIPAKELPAFDFPADPPTAAPEPESPAPRTAPAMPASSDPFFGTLDTHRVSPFAYDAKYRWLKGVVTKENDGTWSIVYSDNPHPNDQLAGQITLSGSPLLSKLQDGDIVQIDGQVDTRSRDRLGKAVYLVTAVKRVSGQ